MHTCWLCKHTGATIKAEPQSPDWKVWWFHKNCYWQLQTLIYD